MISKWENEEERLLRFMKISPKKKLEWLLEMNEFLYKCTLKGPGKDRRKGSNTQPAFG
jgi:hypothetical protein